MKVNLFIALTPLHVFVVKILIKHLDIKNYKVLITKEYIKYFNENDTIIFDIAEFNDQKLLKLLKLLKLKLSKIRYQNLLYDKVFIPSDANPYIQIILSKIKFDELIYYEEGGTLLYKINELIYNKPQVRNIALKKMIGLSNIDNVLKDQRIKKAYVFFPGILSTFNKKIEFKNLEDIIYKYKIDLNYPIIETKYQNPDILIFTQPLSIDRYCTNQAEILAIEEFIRDNMDKKILIKLHPRDELKDYIFLNKYNIEFMPNEYQEIPYQVLHSDINPKKIVSFFSSVLFSVPKIRNDFERISLINMIPETKIKKIVLKMKEYFSDLTIINKEGI